METADDPQLTSLVTNETVTEIVTPERPESPPVTDSGADIIGEVCMPEVRPGAVREATSKPTAEAAPIQAPGVPRKGITDDKGRTFDPAVHEVGPDGKGLINSKGYLKCRRGAAAQRANKGTAHASKLDPGAPPSAFTTSGPTAAAAQLEAQIQATATTAATILFTASQMIGGEEFAPRVDARTGENEPAFIEGAFAGYFRSKGVVDIPPGAALAIALVAYAGKRWNAPKFTERRKGWWEQVKSWLADRRQRAELERQALARKNAAGF